MCFLFAVYTSETIQETVLGIVLRDIAKSEVKITNTGNI